MSAPGLACEMVRVQIHLTESTSYTRTVSMPRDKFERMQAGLALGLPGVSGAVAESLFDDCVDRTLDETGDLEFKVTMKEVPHAAVANS